jgi:hypothetical protein
MSLLNAVLRWLRYRLMMRRLAKISRQYRRARR